MVDAAVPRRHMVVEALVLVFSHSEVRELVGTDALRTVVTGQYRELVVGNTLNLQPIWDLLSDQPGFDADKAGPGFFLLETWKSDLGLEVVLPAELSEVGPDERRAAAATCSVPSDDKQAVFRGVDKATPTPAPRPAKPSAHKTGPLSIDAVAGESDNRRPTLEIIAALVAAAAFTFIGITLYHACEGPAWVEVEVALPAELPVSGTERIGSELHATLADESWLGEPAGARRAVLEQALEGLRSEGIDIFVVVDAKGSTVASAQWVGDPPRPVVKLH